ncbi:MAG: helix-turn-helix domain-containing protein [Candidatus Obscuribacterales bacterium]|nr:helix-turn-helix domain-containing protein [Candidatus Obscuribacterales bacterium]
MLRRRKHLSQEAFAALAEIDRSYMGAVERGEQNPSLWILWRIAHALGITISELCQDV